MQRTLQITGVALGLMVFSASLAAVQLSTGAGETTQPAVKACTLLTNADVEKVTGQKMFTEPTPMSLKGGAGALCGFDNAQVIIFGGENSEAAWNSFLEGFGYADVQKFPMPGLGDRAYSFYFVPKSQRQDAGTFIVVFKGEKTLAVSVSAEEGQPAESVQSQAVELAKLVLAKLP